MSVLLRERAATGILSPSFLIPETFESLDTFLHGCIKDRYDSIAFPLWRTLMSRCSFFGADIPPPNSTGLSMIKSHPMLQEDALHTEPPQSSAKPQRGSKDCTRIS